MGRPVPRPQSWDQIAAHGRLNYEVKALAEEFWYATGQDALSVARSTFYDWRAARKGPPCF